MDEETGRVPPLACQNCSLGHFALYGPTRDATPGEIYTRRRGVLKIAPQKTFLREGEVMSQIFTLYSGWAFSFKQMPDGRRQILSFLIPGDAIMLENLYFPNFALPFSVKSLTAVAVCVFKLEDMILLTKASGAQARQLAATMHYNVACMNRRLVDMGRRSALGRVAQLILELEERLRGRGLSKEGRFHFPVRQEDIADALGLTTVYINRTLDRLRRLNVIAFDRQWMTVRDIPALRIIAEEE